MDQMEGDIEEFEADDEPVQLSACRQKVAAVVLRAAPPKAEYHAPP